MNTLGPSRVDPPAEQRDGLDRKTRADEELADPGQGRHLAAGLLPHLASGKRLIGLVGPVAETRDRLETPGSLGTPDQPGAELFDQHDAVGLRVEQQDRDRREALQSLPDDRRTPAATEAFVSQLQSVELEKTPPHRLTTQDLVVFSHKKSPLE